MDDTIYLHCLSKIPGVGAEKLRQLSLHFGSAQSAWNGDPSELRRAGLSEKLTAIITKSRASIDPENESQSIEKHGIRLISQESDEYPPLLREIPNPPYLLYVRGGIDLNAGPCITVVGTRRPTEYGLGIAREFSRELARIGITVVSGLALGIDQEAHRGALLEGKTLAVLGNGVDDASIAPRTHLELARSIVLQGGLLSDYPPGTQASAGTFPARNRLMAGISLGTVVVESTEKSGTLITARLALEFNRDVFAIPGSIYSEYSRGPHSLLKEGAILAGSVADILDALPISRVPRKETLGKDDAGSEINLSPDEAFLLKTLGCDTLHIDTIVKRSSMSASDAISTIAFLEMKGLVKNIGSMHYIRTYRMNSK